MTQDPTADTNGKVNVSVTVESKNGTAYIGWRSSDSSARFTDNSGFTDITGTKEFTVSNNGWYAVCAVDNAGNFNFNLKQISNIIILPTVTVAGQGLFFHGLDR